MPLRSDIKKVMVLGSGPIVIGQAAEFDYAGTQACRALREEGLEVVLVNSNPATIMTDKAMADKVYIEPMTVAAVKEIIKKERPDSLLPNLGGQTGLNLAMELCEEGFLDEMGVKLLGANPETIAKAEDRQMFKDTMEKINEPIIASKVVHSVEDADTSPSRLVCRSSFVRRTPSAVPAAVLHTPGTNCVKLRQQVSCTPVSIRSWSRNVSQAGRKSNTRLCATTRATPSPSVTWRT